VDKLANHGDNHRVPPRLPRFAAMAERIADARRIAEIVLEAETAEPVTSQAARSTPAGAEARLRGVPAIGRGVRGAITGSVPHLDGIRERRRQ
jgi:hypothetical protein